MQKSIHTPGYAALRNELRKARQKADLSQRELAERLSVGHSVIAKIEGGERRIDPVEMCWLLMACGVDPVPVFKRVLASAGSPQDRRSGTSERRS